MIPQFTTYKKNVTLYYLLYVFGTILLLLFVSKSQCNIRFEPINYQLDHPLLIWVIYRYHANTLFSIPTLCYTFLTSTCYTFNSWKVLPKISNITLHIINIKFLKGCSMPTTSLELYFCLCKSTSSDICPKWTSWQEIFPLDPHDLLHFVWYLKEL